MHITIALKKILIKHQKRFILYEMFVKFKLYKRNNNYSPFCFTILVNTLDIGCYDVCLSFVKIIGSNAKRLEGKVMNQRDDWHQLESARNRFIQEISKNMYLYGINESIGRLYGIVFFAEHPMTLDEMSKELGMSKTSMSTGIRTLTEADMVERVWKKGVRKDLYQTEEDWYKSFSSLFINRWRTAVDDNLEAVYELKKTLDDLKEHTEDENLKEAIQTDLDKIIKAKNYYEWLGEVIKVFETGKIFELVPKK